jgi:hypothetical protein
LLRFFLAKNRLCCLTAESLAVCVFFARNQMYKTAHDGVPADPARAAMWADRMAALQRGEDKAAEADGEDGNDDDDADDDEEEEKPAAGLRNAAEDSDDASEASSEDNSDAESDASDE